MDEEKTRAHRSPRDRDFHYEGERKRQLGEAWNKKFKDNFDYTINCITEIQARRLLYIEIVFLNLIIGLITNILSTNIYDLIFTGNYKVLSIFSILTICFIIFCCFGFLKMVNENYKPYKTPLHLTFRLEDMKEFVGETTYIKILMFLDNKELNDFSKFSEPFRNTFVSFFPYLFDPEISKVPIIDKTEYLDDIYKPRFPKHRLVFDLSDLNLVNVNTHLDILLVPKVIFSFTTEGDETAVRDIVIHIWFNILNPEHHKSDEVLRQFYERFTKRLPEYLSLSLLRSFYQYIPELKPKRPSAILRKQNQTSKRETNL